jgi:hypothetical protein
VVVNNSTISTKRKINSHLYSLNIKRRRHRNTCSGCFLLITFILTYLRRVWRYQRGNQNQYIEEGQTTQWLKEKVQKDKQRYTKLTYKTKDRVTRTPLITRGELRCSGRVGGSCSTSGTRCVTNVITICCIQ